MRVPLASEWDGMIDIYIEGRVFHTPETRLGWLFGERNKDEEDVLEFTNSLDLFIFKETTKQQFTFQNGKKVKLY